MNNENGQNSSRGRIGADRDGKSKGKRERIRFNPKDTKALFSTSAPRERGTSPDYDSRRRPEGGNSRPFGNRYNDTRMQDSRPNSRYEQGDNRNYRPTNNSRFDNNTDYNSRFQERGTGYQERNRSYQGNGEHGGYNSGDRPQRSYQNYGDRPQRGGYNNDDRPQRSYQNYGDRPQRGGYNNDDRPQRPYRPRTNDYDPNAKYSHKKQMEYKRKDIDPTKPVRLNKYLANAGICSRREADEYIQAGVITVNGEVVSEMGTKVLLTDKVMFHDQPIRSERKVYILLNKPKNCVTTTEDTHERQTVMDLVKNACSERVYPVGRLDRNTTGVLLLTNDGDLAARLTHPKHHKKKIYHAVLDKPLESEDYDKLMAGVKLDEENTIAPDALEFIKEGDTTQVGVEIHSGQNRVVRRMFERIGYKVIRLDRVFFAGLTKKNLKRGTWRILNQREINMLLMGAFE